MKSIFCVFLAISIFPVYAQNPFMFPQHSRNPFEHSRGGPGICSLLVKKTGPKQRPSEQQIRRSYDLLKNGDYLKFGQAFIGGKELYYRWAPPTAFGATTHVMFHGNGVDSKDVKEAAVAAIERGEGVLLFDMSGMGKSLIRNLENGSVVFGTPYTLSDMYYAVPIVMTKLKVRNFVLIGHSLGALLAARLASNPDVRRMGLRGLYLVDPAVNEGYLVKYYADLATAIVPMFTATKAWMDSMSRMGLMPPDLYDFIAQNNTRMFSFMMVNFELTRIISENSARWGTPPPQLILTQVAAALSYYREWAFSGADLVRTYPHANFPTSLEPDLTVPVYVYQAGHSGVFVPQESERLVRTWRSMGFSVTRFFADRDQHEGPNGILQDNRVIDQLANH